MTLDARAVAELGRTVAAQPAAPFVERIGRALGATSWMLRLDAAGRVRAVTMLGARASPPPPAPTRRRESPFDLLHDLPVDGPVARVLGAGKASVRQLADVVLRQDDLVVRGEAVRAAVAAMMRDPALEQAVLAALDAVSDAQLADLVASAGGAAGAVVSLVAAEARGRPLGRRAAAILPRLAGR